VTTTPARSTATPASPTADRRPGSTSDQHGNSKGGGDVVVKQGSITLKDFQEDDYLKIRKQKSGCIGSEMGTGKTHVAIALEQYWWQEVKEKLGGRELPSLVVAPLNTFDSWQEKYAMQAPDVDVVTIDRKNREAFVRAIRQKKGDVFLMHWDALRLVWKDLRDIEFAVVVADEAHRASNRKAQATQALKKLKAHRRLAMSGTLSGDKPEGLWSPLNWLWPSFYRAYWKFRQHYCVEEVAQQGYRKIVGVQNIESLKAEMRPWYVRHLKREQCCEHHPNGVMAELPEKTYDTIWVDLNPTQKRFYEQMRKNMVAWVNENEDSPLAASVVVAQMTRLTQMALATPYIAGTKWVTKKVDGEKVRVEVDDVRLKAPSSKIDAVKEFISDHPEKSFVVFTSSKQAAYLAQQAFEAAGISAEVLSGDTPQAQREGMVARFGRREYRVFIGVIQAAAEGIDGLQHVCDTAIFLDRSWSTIKNMQAEDRLHRGGSEVHDSIQIIDVMARGTLDFGRKQKLEEKWSWIKEILGDPVRAQKEMTQHG
jgi:SNF2 family DNA or RNA helicase